MSKSQWAGKRFICMLRQSDDKEGNSSVQAQLAFLMQEGEKLGMKYVDKISLEGVSGSLPGNRSDLTALFERKRQKDDFDILMLQRVDRLTRGGTSHGFWIEHECTRAGITLIFAGDDIPQGRYASLIKVAKYESAFEQAFGTSQRTSQGMQFALENGNAITCTHTPYGCWRLYLSADGTPNHIIRDLRDGRQWKLHPHTYEMIDSYGTIGGGSRGHYRKQSSEKVLLTHGDANEAQVVREIFQLHFIEGWGGKRISDHLNRRSVPSPRGKQWSQRQVESVYEQEAYTGRTVGNRHSSGIHHKRSRGGPQPLNRTQTELATAKSLRPKLRDFDEWEIQKQPLLDDFLDERVKKLALAAHEIRWKRMCNPHRKPRSTSKHATSEYLLSNLLTAKQDGEKLVGVLCGKEGHRIRYYRHKKGRRGYTKGSIYNKMFPAEKLEKPIVEMIAGILLDLPNLREKVTGFVVAQMRSSDDLTLHLEDLISSREKIKKRTNLIVATLDDDALQDVKQELSRLAAERRSLDEQIVAAKATRQHSVMPPEETAQRVLEQLAQLGNDLPKLPNYALRQVLMNLLSSVVCDMGSKRVEISLTLPLWALVNTASIDERMRTVTSQQLPASYDTHTGSGLKLAEIHCIAISQPIRSCYQCTRRAFDERAAA